MIFSKFPPDFPTTQGLMHQHKFGAVIGANPTKVYGNDVSGYGTQPDFSVIDKQLEQATGLETHLHPVISRSLAAGGRDFELLHGRVHELGMPTVKRYSKTVKRMTLAQELILCKEELWGELIDFYKAVAVDHPDVELWIGETYLRRESDRGSILTRLKDLEGIAHGFIGADHVELSKKGRKGFAQYAKVTALGLLPIRSRFEYLSGFWKQMKSMGFKVALETSALADPEDDTNLVRKAQANMYQRLGDLCKNKKAEYWLWNLCDDSTRDPADPDRRPVAGVWNAGGSLRLQGLDPGVRS